jgi:hypothetical protein
MMMRNATRRVGLAVAVLALAAGVAGQARADLVVNGGFETGNLTGWTTTGNLGPESVTNDPNFVHSGSFGFSYGQVGALGFLSQTITTVVGQTYTFEFFQKTLSGTPNEFQAFFGGTKILDRVDSPVASTFTKYDFTEVATSTATVISFGLRQDPSFSALDDISVNPTTLSTPEPATIALAASAIPAGLVFWLRRRKRTAIA